MTDIALGRVAFDAARGRRLLDYWPWAWALVNLPLALVGAWIVVHGSWPSDWAIFTEAPHRFFDGSLYVDFGNYAFRWHPLAALAFGPLSWMGVVGWRLLHIAAALALPTWRLRLLVLVSFPFWWDVEAGNVIVFLFLAAAWALRGSGIATAAFLVAAVLIPRPLMLPVVAWLLWQRPEWRWPFVGIVVAAVLSAFATGYGPEWIAKLAGSSSELGAQWNLGPSRIVGAWWLLAGVPLAAWLTVRGRIGLASLAISPYLLPYYLLFGLLEVRHRRVPRGRSADQPVGHFPRREQVAGSPRLGSHDLELEVRRMGNDDVGRV